MTFGSGAIDSRTMEANMAAHDDFDAFEYQLEQQNRSVTELKNSVSSYYDETSKCFDRLNNQADLILEMLRELSNEIRNEKSPSEYGSEFSLMNPHPDDTIFDAAVFTRRSEQKVEAFTSTTPIAGTYPIPIRFEEAVDGREIITEIDPCCEVCTAFEFNEATPTALFNEQENGRYTHNLFDEMSHPEIEENDQLHGAEDVGDGHSDEILDHIEEVSGNDVSPFANVSIADESVVDYEVNSHTGTPFIRFPSLVFTGLKSFPKELNSIPTNERDDLYSLKADIQHMNMNKEDELKLAKFVMFKDAYQVFDKMPQLTFVWPFKEIFGAKSFVPLIDCVPKVFDPGDGIDPVVPVGWRFNEMKDPSCAKARENLPKNYKLYDGFELNMILTFIFSPGGSLKHSVGCDSINSERINAEAVAVKYVYGAGDISSNHGSDKVLHWDKVVGGSERKTVRSPFMEQSKDMEVALMLPFGSVEIVHQAFIIIPKLKMANFIPLPMCDSQVFDPGIAVIGSISTNGLEHEGITEFGSQDRPCVEIEVQIEIVFVNLLLLSLNSVAKGVIHSESGSHSSVDEDFMPRSIALQLISLIKSCNTHFREAAFKILHCNSSYREVYDTLVVVLDEVLSNAPHIVQTALTATTYKLINDSELKPQEATYNQDFAHFGAVAFLFDRSFQPGTSTQARETIQGQSVLLFTSSQALSSREASQIIHSEMHSEIQINCYTFIVVQEHFVWDPGTRFVVVPFYILEDKDDVERVGKDMILMDTTLVIKGNDHMVQMRYVNKTELLTGDVLATKMVMFNGVERNVQTDLCWSFLQEANSIDITIIHCSLEAFSQLKILKSFPKLWMNVKVESNLRPVVNEDRPFVLNWTYLLFCQDMIPYIWMLRYDSLHMVGGCSSFVVVVENFVWDHLGLFSILHLEDKVVVEGKDMSRYDILLLLLLFYYSFYIYIRIYVFSGFDVM